MGGRGGRRLLTIWIVLLANLQQTGWGTNRWREGEGAVVGHSSRHPSRRRLSHMGFTELRGGGTGGEREKDRNYRREGQWEKGGIRVKSTAASNRSMLFLSNQTKVWCKICPKMFFFLCADVCFEDYKASPLNSLQNIDIKIYITIFHITAIIVNVFFTLTKRKYRFVLSALYLYFKSACLTQSCLMHCSPNDFIICILSKREDNLFKILSCKFWNIIYIVKLSAIAKNWKLKFIISCVLFS